MFSMFRQNSGAISCGFVAMARYIEWCLIILVSSMLVPKLMTRRRKMAKFLIPLTLDEEQNNSLVALVASLEECFDGVRVRTLLEVETDNNLLNQHARH